MIAETARASRSFFARLAFVLQRHIRSSDPPCPFYSFQDLIVFLQNHTSRSVPIVRRASVGLSKKENHGKIKVHSTCHGRKDSLLEGKRCEDVFIYIGVYKIYLPDIANHNLVG